MQKAEAKKISAGRNSSTILMRSKLYPSAEFPELQKLADEKKGSFEVTEYIVDDYHHALVKACVKAAGGDVVDVMSVFKTPGRNSFTREIMLLC
jgi:hypothetical protein